MSPMSPMSMTAALSPLSPPPPRAALPPAAAAADAAARGCGSWFESSRELLQGMRVIEHAGFEALARDVPLAWSLAGY